MNKNRRAWIARAAALIDEAAVMLAESSMEETDYADNMPDNMHGCEKHDLAYEVAALLDEHSDACFELVLSIGDIES